MRKNSGVVNELASQSTNVGIGAADMNSECPASSHRIRTVLVGNHFLVTFAVRIFKITFLVVPVIFYLFHSSRLEFLHNAILHTKDKLNCLSQPKNAK